ncbi:hypothetical protein N7492_004411 [Penicillium capsulatum]|uniref:Uncharacterized protein n=1 Tax=Penicillium capsulatum TaxID=69766 RepID=A0A9W9LR48_9EURO|nr:hypothetical protein N7492_004411 [Penicillium capsulatum]KAJ6136468.1 hypothetical protein N7512_001628 [Penicillium capsulatum]
MPHLYDLPNELLTNIVWHVIQALPLDFEDGENPASQPKGKGDDAQNPKGVVTGDPADTEGPDDEDEFLDDEDGPDDVDDLRNLCLVSRRMCDISQPVLFRHFIEDTLDGDLRNTVSFARALYRRPDLGKHVQSIVMSEPVDPAIDLPELVTEDLQLFKPAIQDLELGNDEETWLDELKEMNLSVFAALLVMKTPNLRSLTLPGGLFSMKHFSPLFRRNPSLLNGLQDFWAEACESTSTYSIASFEAFLKLPKLQVVIFEYGDLYSGSYPSAWAPGTLAVEDISFHHCYLDAGAIRKLLKACRKLKTFTYENFTLDPTEARDPPTPQSPAEFNSVQALEAARLHKDSLEEFVLDFSREPWDIEDVPAYIARQTKVGSFREFSVLERISLPHAVLPPCPKFCAALKELTITDCNSSIRDMMQHIAKDCKSGHYPALNKIKVLTLDVTQPIQLAGQRRPPGQTPEQCFRSLQALFQGTNVDFQIYPYDMPDLDPYDDDDDIVDDDFANFPGLDPPGLMGGPGRPEGGNGPMPPGLMAFFLQRARQDPDFPNFN